GRVAAGAAPALLEVEAPPPTPHAQSVSLVPSLPEAPRSLTLPPTEDTQSIDASVFQEKSEEAKRNQSGDSTGIQEDYSPSRVRVLLDQPFFRVGGGRDQETEKREGRTENPRNSVRLFLLYAARSNPSPQADGRDSDSARRHILAVEAYDGISSPIAAQLFDFCDDDGGGAAGELFGRSDHHQNQSLIPPYEDVSSSSSSSAARTSTAANTSLCCYPGDAAPFSPFPSLYALLDAP
ncbi:hypothetical protein B296_00053251, partial [Ensete ventricosum]